MSNHEIPPKDKNPHFLDKIGQDAFEQVVGDTLKVDNEKPSKTVKITSGKGSGDSEVEKILDLAKRQDSLQPDEIKKWLTHRLTIAGVGQKKIDGLVADTLEKIKKSGLTEPKAKNNILVETFETGFNTENISGEVGGKDGSLERSREHTVAREQLIETKKELRTKQKEYKELKKLNEMGAVGIIRNFKEKNRLKQLRKEIDELGGKRAVLLTEALHFRGTDKDVSKVRDNEESAEILMRRKQKSKDNLEYSKLSTKKQKKLKEKQLVSTKEKKLRKLQEITKERELVAKEKRQLDNLLSEKAQSEKERNSLQKMWNWYNKQNKLNKAIFGTFLVSGGLIGGGLSLSGAAVGFAPRVIRSVVGMTVGAKTANTFGNWTEKRLERMDAEFRYDIKEGFDISKIGDFNKTFDKQYKKLNATEKSYARSRIGLAFIFGAGAGMGTGVAIAGASEAMTAVNINAPLGHQGVTDFKTTAAKLFNLDSSLSPQTPGGEAIDGVNPVEIKPISVEASSKGAIQTFVDLKDKIREIPGDERSISQQNILKTNAAELAKRYGFYDPENIKESSMILKGDTFKISENGALEYAKANGEIVTLEDGQDFAKSEGQFGDKGGKMFDYQPDPQPSQDSIATATATITAPDAPARSYVVSEPDGEVTTKTASITDTSVTPDSSKAVPEVDSIPEQTRLFIINSGEVRPDTFQFLKIGESMFDKSLNISAEKINATTTIFTKDNISVRLIQWSNHFGKANYIIASELELKNAIANSGNNLQNQMLAVEKVLAKPENNFSKDNGGIDSAFYRVQKLIQEEITNKTSY